jgi:hypothetical protein
MNALFGLFPVTNRRVPTPRFPVEFRGFPELPAPFLRKRIRGPVQSCVQEIRVISLVFREMWDTAGLPLEPSRVSQLRKAPHFRTSVRGPKKMGDPDFLLHRTRQHYVCDFP